MNNTNAKEGVLGALRCTIDDVSKIEAEVVGVAVATAVLTADAAAVPTADEAALLAEWDDVALGELLTLLPVHAQIAVDMRVCKATGHSPARARRLVPRWHDTEKAAAVVASWKVTKMSEAQAERNMRARPKTTSRAAGSYDDHVPIVYPSGGGAPFII